MTRINAAIPVENLCDQHLMAEHREIKRIPNTIKNGKCNLDNIPTDFRLGTGHVKFFYNKLLYLRRRYFDLYEECKKRGFNVTNYHDAFNLLPRHLMNDHKFTQDDRIIVENRIQERLEGMESIRYYSKIISVQQAVKTLKN